MRNQIVINIRIIKNAMKKKGLDFEVEDEDEELMVKDERFT